ncbi:MAG: VWA domain-containing protein, partial [bacterium]
LAFIKELDARGGTAINDALIAALGMNQESNRPAIILFLTDGRPTVGESETKSILDNLRQSNKANTRIFVFGAGVDVNTHLLDQIAGQNGGLPQYVLPEEDIEVKISRLVDKMSSPVLTNVRVEVDKLKTSMIHPTALPDLFSGDQITVFGRYDGSGDSVIRLTGNVNGKKREFVYEGTFPAAQTDNRFIPRLWATRRVGFLLDEIRLRGENTELKDEVIRLSKEYGIMTPYTSYLVLEDEKAYQQHEIVRMTGRLGAGGGAIDRAKRGAPMPAPATEKLDGFLASGTQTESARIVPVFSPRIVTANEPTEMVETESRVTYVADARRMPPRGGSDNNAPMQEVTGAKAVAMSKALQEYKGKDNAADEIATVKHVGKKVFTLLDGRWVDSAFKKEMKTTTVKFGSEEYFKLLTDKPGLKDFLALGTKVTVVLEDETALVVE